MERLKNYEELLMSQLMIIMKKKILVMGLKNLNNLPQFLSISIFVALKCQMALADDEKILGNVQKNIISRHNSFLIIEGFERSFVYGDRA